MKNYNVVEMNEKLSIFMKESRKKKKMTQVSFSKKTKLDIKYLQKIENKKIIIEPRLDTFNRIAKGFNISITDLLKKII